MEVDKDCAVFGIERLWEVNVNGQVYIAHGLIDLSFYLRIRCHSEFVRSSNGLARY